MTDVTADAALVCLLIDWVAGEPDDSLEIEVHPYGLEALLTQEAYCTVSMQQDQPFSLAFVSAAGALMAGEHDVRENYPKPGEFIPFKIPDTLEVFFMTLIHGKNVSILCCHENKALPSELLEDYQSATFALAKYVTIPLPEE